MWQDLFVPGTRIKHYKSERLGTILALWMIGEPSDDLWDILDRTRIEIQFGDGEVAVRRRDAFSPVQGPDLYDLLPWSKLQCEVVSASSASSSSAGTWADSASFYVIEVIAADP